MMQQYEDAKAVCGDALLLFRMGDFYELFHDDAKTAARVLGLTLTSRDKGENPIPMAGFPYHQLDAYLAKLISAGHRAAVCEQMEDPKRAVGIVKREITRVVTPGTLTDDALLDPRASNYLAAVAPPKNGDQTLGLSWAELSTGRFFAATVPAGRLDDELARIAPAETLWPEEGTPGANASGSHASGSLRTCRPAWAFGFDHAVKTLTKHFGTASLEGFGFGDDDSPAVRAAGAILDYLSETQKSSLDHFDRLIPHRSGSRLEIDEATRRSLEITRTLRTNSREGSLLGAVDQTVTPMGSRLLADWIANPLTDIEEINGRLDAVGELADDVALRRDLREQLKGVYDLQRLLARVTTNRAGPRDLQFVGRTLANLPKTKAKLVARKSPLLNRIESEINLCPELRAQLEGALAEECPLGTSDGGFIKPGFSGELDRLRDIAAGGKQWIAQYQAKEIERTGIPSLKVGFNKVFGYYIEITNTHQAKAPAEYIRKQTIKNSERYITPELKEYEEQVLTADEKAQSLEIELFQQLRSAVHAQARQLQATANLLAQLDVLCGLAELAKLRGYCRPTMVEVGQASRLPELDETVPSRQTGSLPHFPVLRVVDGRHPVIEASEAAGTFVPNDVVLGGDDGLVALITGPNMAGKSTYIRQVALTVLLAQTGSFVPAKEATIGVADRIFARVGASDDLSRGQSTFMVEMTETARILNTATSRSLVVLDEIGRGTSTYDGVSLAWAIVEHLHDAVGCRTLFATHYHELTDLASSLVNVRNHNVAVREWEENIVFLHKIVPGAADKSYGIHVARLAGIPRDVNERAKQILAQLESEHLDEAGRPKMAGSKVKRRPRQDLQMTLFTPEHPVVGELRSLDLNGLTPLEAMLKLKELQERAGKA
jgi:DNA mismatch repair protein MutS